jgi:hypothetical protein
MEGETKKRKADAIVFDQNDHKVKSKVQRLSDKFYFDKTYDPPVWDPVNDDDFEPDETIMFYGQRRDGKSTLARWLALKMRRYYPLVYVFSGTAFNNFWQQVLPDHKVILVQFEDPDVLKRTLNEPCDKLLDLNEKRVTLWKQAKANGEATGNPLALTIGEDIVTNETIRKCPAATRIMLNGRHHGIPSWILSQVWVGLTPNQRKNLDRVILFKATDANVEDWVMTTYGAHVVDMYRRVTDEPFTAFVIVNKSRVNGPRFFKVKADVDWVQNMISRNVVLGNKRCWANCDVVEQKARLPEVKLDGRKLRSHFNEVVGVKDEESDDDEIQLVEPTVVEEAPTEVVEVFRSW